MTERRDYYAVTQTRDEADEGFVLALGRAVSVCATRGLP